MARGFASPRARWRRARVRGVQTTLECSYRWTDSDGIYDRSQLAVAAGIEWGTSTVLRAGVRYQRAMTTYWTGATTYFSSTSDQAAGAAFGLGLPVANGFTVDAGGLLMFALKGMSEYPLQLTVSVERSWE